MKFRDLMEGRGKKRDKLRDANVRVLVDNGIDLRCLWRLGGYDGMCTGVCEVDRVMCYLYCPVSFLARHRIYVAVALTDEQQVALIDRRTWALEAGGTHHNFTYVDGKRRYGEYVPPVDPETYKAYCASISYLEHRAYYDNDVVGWCEP